MLRGVLAPGYVQCTYPGARPSARSIINMSGIFSVHLSAKSPSNITPNPSEVISRVPELEDKFQNTPVSCPKIVSWPANQKNIWKWQGWSEYQYWHVIVKLGQSLSWNWQFLDPKTVPFWWVLVPEINRFWGSETFKVGLLLSPETDLKAVALYMLFCFWKEWSFNN